MHDKDRAKREKMRGTTIHLLILGKLAGLECTSVFHIRWWWMLRRRILSSALFLSCTRWEMNHLRGGSVLGKPAQWNWWNFPLNQFFVAKSLRNFWAYIGQRSAALGRINATWVFDDIAITLQNEFSIFQGETSNFYVSLAHERRNTCIGTSYTLCVDNSTTRIVVACQSQIRRMKEYVCARRDKKTVRIIPKIFVWMRLRRRNPDIVNNESNRSYVNHARLQIYWRLTMQQYLSISGVWMWMHRWMNGMRVFVRLLLSGVTCVPKPCMECAVIGLRTFLSLHTSYSAYAYPCHSGPFFRSPFLSLFEHTSVMLSAEFFFGFFFQSKRFSRC